jgi:signal transduction histidine kinase
MPADTELTLYRILQEALNNVEKHARARHVAVSLKQMGDFVQLAIVDDGIGFEPGVYPARRKGKGRLGLLSMRERATYMGGTLNITSAPGKGTTVLVQVSLILRAPVGGAQKPD